MSKRKEFDQMNNVAQREEIHIIEENELTDTQLVNVLGALDGVGDTGLSSLGDTSLDSLGDDLDLGSTSPNVTRRFEVSSSSPAASTGSYNKHLVLLALVKNISQLA
jgi:hypothetical protein